MLKGLLEKEKLIEEEKDAASDKMDEHESDFIQSDYRKSKGHLCPGRDCYFRKDVHLPYFHPMDPMNLSKTFRRSVRIDDDNEGADRHTRSTMQEGSSRWHPSGTMQNAATKQEMDITEEPKAETSSDMEEEFLKGDEGKFMSKYSKASKFSEVRPDEYNADHLYKGQRCPSLSAIQEVSEPEPVDELKTSNLAAKAETAGSIEGKVSPPLYQNYHRFYDDEQDSGLDMEESGGKTDQNSDPEAKLDMIKALHERAIGEGIPYEIIPNDEENTNDQIRDSELEKLLDDKENVSPSEGETSPKLVNDERPSNVGRSNWDNFLSNFPLMEHPVEEQNPVEHFDRKRKGCEMEEPQLKKAKFDIPKETEDKTASKPKQVKRKLDGSDSTLDPFEKKSKLTDPDKESECDSEKADEKTKDNEPKDDNDKPGTSKNHRSGA